VSASLVLRLAVDLAPSDRGGRRRPLADGYRASLSDGRRRRHVEPVVHDAVLVLEDTDALAPGAAAVARAYVVLPEELPRAFGVAGTVLTLLEGDRIVGRARVLDVLYDDAPAPLRDLAAAKRRALRRAPDADGR
jgi:hypothetical protein